MMPVSSTAGVPARAGGPPGSGSVEVFMELRGEGTADRGGPAAPGRPTMPGAAVAGPALA
ncbi:hypothetical protein GCM10023222_11930 [Saccharopolyspora cebuensis]